jgi:hypothetical protein
MKKVIAMLAVAAFALTFVACGKKAPEAEVQDTTATVEPAPAAPDTTGTDTVGTDTTAH